jgi:hypothetical protein
MTRTIQKALIIWVVLTFLILAESIWIFTRHGLSGFQAFMQAGPYTNIPLTFASVALLWILIGLLFWLLLNGIITRNTLAHWAGFFMIAFSYLNILRERVRYGDIDYYFQAASNLFNHLPLPASYLYPPLWATLLSFMVPSGEDMILLVAWIANILSLLLFYFLLIHILEHYQFKPHTAVFTSTGFMLINMPILRTLLYVQVNLHIINLIFLSILLYKDRVFLSALALALAVHLKASPAILILAFLLEFNWKWLAWFTFNLIVIAGFTIAVYGLTPYFDFVNNFLLLNAPRELSLRDNSFDSAIGMTLSYFHVDLFFTRILVYLAKGITAWVVIILGVRSRIFFPEKKAGAALYNSIVPLLIAMTILSPLIWEHHGVFLALPAILLIRKLESPAEWTFFGMAYLFVFLMPTFDYYPWSYIRLLGILTLLALLWKVRSQQDTIFFPAFNTWTESIINPNLK